MKSKDSINRADKLPKEDNSKNSIIINKKDGGNGDHGVFNSHNIETRSSLYDLYVSGSIPDDPILQNQNPALMAFRNRNVKGTRPVLYSPIASIKKPNVIPGSSMFPKRPLSESNHEVPALSCVKHQIELEKKTIDFKEDPIAYFSKRKDGRGHLFIYMVYSHQKKDPMFSPYSLTKVPSAETGTEFFTMSASGVTHVLPDGSTDTYTLDEWSREDSIYQSLRKLRVFQQYNLWKPIRIWRNYLINQRFHKLVSGVTCHPFFRNRLFFTESLSVYFSQEDPIQFLRDHLLCFNVSRKYQIKQFEEKNQENKKILKKKYVAFLSKTTQSIIELYNKVSNPIRVQVHDSDFPEVQRRNPNVEQLVGLEKKKALTRANNTISVNEEISSIGKLIRMVDYILLEALSRGCEECWNAAENTIAQEGSSVFQVEVKFANDGSVLFEPPLNILEEKISQSLWKSLEILSNLPRVFNDPNLKALVINSGYKLFSKKDLPSINHFTNVSQILKPIEKKIIHTIRASFNDANIFAQSYSIYYPIYEIGMSWNVSKYLITRSGKPFVGNFSNRKRDESDDMFLLNSDQEPILDINTVMKDIERFQVYEQNVSNLRPGVVKGALHIDSKDLRSFLTPIPTRALLEIQDLIKNLTENKIVSLTNTLKFYGKNLKQEPQTLDSFVSLCDIIQRANAISSAIQSEILFIDQSNNVLDHFGYQHNRNPLHSAYSVFLSDKEIALSIRNQHYDSFVKNLKDTIKEIEEKLNHYYNKTSSIPAMISEIDTDKMIPQAEKLLQKVSVLDSQVKMVIKYQDSIGVEMNRFAFFSNVQNAAEFALDLYLGIGSWNKLHEQITKVPFSEVDMPMFKADILSLSDSITRLQNNQKVSNCPVLGDLSMKMHEISPFINELEKLSHGRMQARHWNTLFEECLQQVSYSNSLTIEGLLKLHILENKEKIERITQMSHGEYQLETQFYSIANFWNKIQLPITETNGTINEDNLLLGSTEKLINEINSALISLTQMLTYPYVQGIKDTVSSLISTLDNISQILESWGLFQSNWIILSVIFSHEQTKSLLPQQANRYAGVQRKWSTIARHTIKDSRLFSVCQFPSLLEALKENNSAMETIVSSLGKLLDAKRSVIPRLYFLSNDDVLSLISTTKYGIFNRTAIKIFMGVNSFDSRIDGENSKLLLNEDTPFNSIIVDGLIGDNGIPLKFISSVICDGSIDSCLDRIINQMLLTVRTAIKEELESFEQIRFTSWITRRPLSVLLPALRIVFTREIDNYVKNFEKNSNYSDIMKKRIDQLIDLMRNSTDISLKYQASMIMLLVLSYKDRFSYLVEKQQMQNIDFIWNQMLRFKYTSNLESIIIESSNYSWVYGNEFWGKIPAHVFSQSTEEAYHSILHITNEIGMPLVTSSSTSGKRQFILQLSSDFGRFSYVWRPFLESCEFFLCRVLIGTSSSASWCVFSHIETLSYKILSYLFDNTRNFYSLIFNNVSRITISSKTVELKPESRIFFTASPEFHMSHSIPPQMKSYIRSISISSPNYISVIEAKLISLGFVNFSKISKKLILFVETMNSLLIGTSFKRSSLHSMFIIVLYANKFLVDIKDEMISIILGCYRFFSVSNDSEMNNNLLATIESSFSMNQSIEELLKQYETVHRNQKLCKLRNYIRSECELLKGLIPVDYIYDQATHFLDLLMNFKCVIIAGPASSGKSTIVRVIEKAIEKAISSGEEIGLSPLHMLDCFFKSDKPERVFGHVYDDLTFGPTWSYGLIQSQLYSLHNKNQNHLNILRFDGPFVREFAIFLENFIGYSYGDSFVLSSQDCYLNYDRFKVILETTEVSQLTPALMANCGIVFMQNAQNIRGIKFEYNSCELCDPLLVLSHAIISNQISSIFQDSVKEIFCEYAPQVVKRVYHTNNHVCFSENRNSHHNSEEIISSFLPSLCIKLSYLMMKQSNSDLMNHDIVKTALSLSFVRVYGSIMEEAERQQFDQWIRTLMKIELPNDWVGYGVPDSFWNTFPRPSLISMKLNRNKIEPLNFQILDEKPYYQLRSENRMPIFISDVFVVHSQVLSPLDTSMMYLQSKQNFILHGSSDSGKTSFLNILFSSNESFSPIYINAADCQTGESVLQFLSTHSPFFSKTQAIFQQKTHVIVFENVSTRHVHLLEFIRMIVSSSHFTGFSSTDPKVHDLFDFTPFQIIITTRNYSLLSPRFLSRFSPVYLDPISTNNAHFITKKILSEYSYSDSQCAKLIRFSSSIINQFSFRFTNLVLMKSIFTVCHLEDKNDTQMCLKAIIADLFMLGLHSISLTEITEKMGFILKTTLKSESEKRVIQELLLFKSLDTPLYELSKDIKSFSVSLKQFEYNDLEEELNNSLSQYNANSSEKIYLRFPKPIINEYSLLYRCLTCPGVNVLLRGDNSTGKYSMSRLIAYVNEYDFVNIAPPTAEEQLVKYDRMASLFSVFRDVVTNAVLHQKRTLFFIRATESTFDECHLLADFLLDRDFAPFFQKNQLEDLYMRFSNLHNLNFEQRLHSMKLIKNIIRTNVHAVISIPNGFKFVRKSGMFVSMYINHDMKDVYMAYAQSSFESPAPKKLIGTQSLQLSKFMITIVDYVKKMMPYMHPNIMFDFIDSVSHFSATFYQDVFYKNENIQSALSFIQRLEIESRSIDKKLDSLAPTLQRLQVDSDSLHASYSTRKDAIDNRQTKLIEERKNKISEVDELKNEVNMLKTQIDGLATKLVSSRKAVEGLKDNDIETIRISAADPLPSLRLLVEVFCIFLDFAPSYERSGQKLLMDPRFILVLTSRIGNDSISPQILNSVNPYFKQEALNPSELEAIAPALSVLYEWIYTVCLNATLSDQLSKQQLLLEEKERLLSLYIDEMEIEIQSIHQVNLSLENELKNLQSSITSRQQMEKDYKVVDSRKKVVDSIFKDIDHFTEKWQLIIKDFVIVKEKLIGDAILFGFYLVFGGIISSSSRFEVLSQMKNMIKDAGFDINDIEPYDFISEKFILIKPDHYYGRFDTPKSQFFCIDVHHVLATIRTPLLVDPDGLATTQLLQLLGNSVSCSLFSSILEITAAQCISEGKTLIVNDVVFLHPIISVLLPLDQVPQDHLIGKEIRIGGKVVIWDTEFKLILITPICDFERLPRNLLSRVSVINASDSSYQAIKVNIRYLFMSYFHQDLVNKAMSVKKSEITTQVDLLKHERDMLDLISDIVATQMANPNYDYLSDQETIDSLLKSKENYFACIHSSNDYNVIREEFNQSLKFYKQYINLCSVFWVAASRILPKITKSAIFSFSSYFKQIGLIFTNEGFHQSGLTAEQLVIMKNSIISTSLQFFLPAFSLRESLFFLFVSGFLIKKHNDKITQKDINAVFDHICHEYDQNIDFNDLSLNDSSSDSFEQLKYSNVASVFHKIIGFIMEVFGHDYVSLIPFFNTDSVISNNSTIPSIVLSTPYHDPSALLYNYIHQRVKTENLDAISLVDDLDLLKNAKKVLTTAMSRGNWVLLHISRPAFAITSILSDIFHFMTTSSISSSFRLIIITTSSDYLAPSIILKSKRSYFHSFPSIRLTMQQLLSHHLSLIYSSKSSINMIRLSYALAMSVSVNFFHRHIKPMGYSSLLNNFESSMTSALQKLLVLLSVCGNNVSIESVRSILAKTMYAGITDVDDYQIALEINKDTVPNNVLSEWFSLIPDSTMWAYPYDVPLSSFMSFIQRIPLFPKIDVLNVSSKHVNHLLNWSYTRWVSHPFIVYNKKLQIHTNIMNKIHDILINIPQMIRTQTESKFLGLIGDFLLKETNHLNGICKSIIGSLNVLENQIKEEISIDNIFYDIQKDTVPLSWKVSSLVQSYSKISSLTSFLVQCHKQMIEWLTNGFNNIISAPHIFFVKDLISAFSVNECIRQSKTLSEVSLTFIISDIPPPQPSICLKNVYVFMASINNGIISPPSKSRTNPFTKLNGLYCIITPSQQRKTNTVSISMYTEAQIYQDEILPVLEECRSSNWICNADFEKSDEEYSFILNRASLFCRIPEQFS